MLFWLLLMLVSIVAFSFGYNTGSVIDQNAIKDLETRLETLERKVQRQPWGK